MVVAPRSLPREMQPTSELSFNLPSGRVVIQSASPNFAPWPAGRPRPMDTKGNKPLVDTGGRASFGELAVLEAFLREGWDGRWIDNYPLPPTFRVAYWDDQLGKLPRAAANVALPPAPRAVYDSICMEAGDPRGGGAWDLIAWRGAEMVFVEAKKRASGDKIRDAQLRWLEAASRLGIPAQCFLLAEWTAR